MDNNIIKRIEKKLNMPNLVDILIDRINLSDLNTILIEVIRRRTDKFTAYDVFRNYKTNRFVTPAVINSKDYNKFESLVYDVVDNDFENYQLSPVSPLGCCSVVASVSQNKILSTTRNIEVCSDPTNVLALESAKRREELLKSNKSDKTKIKLCTSHRVLRTQVFKKPNSFPHFKVFCLCTSGQDQGSYLFETESLLEQLRIYFQIFNKCKKIGVEINSLKLKISLYEERLKVKVNDLFKVIKHAFPQIKTEFNLDVSKQNYYSLLNFQIYGCNNKGEEFMLGDGGFVDWTQQFLQNKKERCLISGIGIERFFLCFPS